MPSVPQHVRKSLSNLPLGRLSGRRDHINRILENVRWGATRVGLVIVVVGAIVVAFAAPRRGKYRVRHDLPDVLRLEPDRHAQRQCDTGPLG